MAEKKLTFITAHYTNPERSNVAVIYAHEDGSLKIDYCAPKIGEPVFDAALEHFDLEDLPDMTYKYYQDQRRAYEQEVIQIAEKEGLIWDIEKADTDMLYRGFASVIFGKDHNKDPDHKEKLFIFKLQLFELPQFRTSKNKQLKTKMRKAQNVIELVSLAAEMWNEIYSTTPDSSETESAD